MALVQQTCRHADGLELSFLAFKHPVTGEVWITGNSVAESLNYSLPRKAVIDHVTDEFKKKWSDLIADIPSSTDLVLPSKWQKNTMMINEGGVNLLIMSSKLPNAVKYKEWVCGVVLPAIRRHGKYEFGKEDVSEVAAAAAVENEDEPMDTDVVDVLTHTRALLALSEKNAELERERRERVEEINNLQLKRVEEANRMQLERVEERSRLQLQIMELASCNREMRTRLFFQMERGLSIDDAHIRTLIGRKVEREKNERFDAKLASNFRLSRNDVNPARVDVVAFVHNRSLDTYRMVKRNRTTFNDEFRFAQVSRASEVLHRVTGLPKRRSNEARQVVVGREYETVNSRNEWDRFVALNEAVVFGLDFLNASYVEFRVLDEARLREKFAVFADIHERRLAVDLLFSTKAQRLIMHKNLELFVRLRFLDAADCVSRCLVPDVWHLVELLGRQIGSSTDDVQSLRGIVDDEMRERRFELESNASELTTTSQRKYEDRASAMMSPREIRQFANLETMFVLDEEVDNVGEYRRYLELLSRRPSRGVLRADHSGDDDDTTVSAVDRLLFDLDNKRQSLPPPYNA